MSKQVLVTVSDDLDGREGAETFSFGFDGVAYEIDLAPENVEKFREAIKPYIEKATKVKNAATKPAKRAQANAGNSDENHAIREWAEANGVSISKRGRISAEVRQQYRDSKAAALAEAANDTKAEAVETKGKSSKKDNS